MISLGNRKMIVVTDIKYYEIDADTFQSERMNPCSFVTVQTKDGSINKDTITVHRDIINGRRFRRRDGELIVGLSNEVAELFYMQEAAWKAMERELERLRAINHQKTARIEELESQGFWERLTSWRYRVK